MNRKPIAVSTILMILFISCASTGSGSGYSLYDAIEQSAEQIANNLPAGSRVAIVAFTSGNDHVSDYIMEEITGALFDRGIEVADRQNLEYVFKELNFQMSGNVSEESAKEIGRFLAADMVITGDLVDLDSLYRYRTNAISVETAVRASVTRLDVRADSATRRMITALENQKTTTKTAKYGVSADVTPQTAGTFLDRGILFASRGDYEMAIADFTEAIRLNPEMSAAYSMRGRALFASVSRVINVGKNFSGLDTITTSGRVSPEQARVIDRAIGDFTQAIRLAPNSASAYGERGVAYANKGDFDHAITDYNQALRINPNLAEAYNNRGNAYSDKRDYDRAIADFKQAIRINPNLAETYNNRGNAYRGKGDFDRAIADYNQALRINPNYAEAYNNRGVAYFNKRDYDRAIADFNQAIRINPNYAEAYAGRGAVYFSKNDFDRVIADLNQAIRIDPNNAPVYAGRGAAYFSKNDYDRAIADFNQAIRIDPNNAPTYTVRGNAYLLKNDFTRAIADYEAALRINPNDATTRQLLEEARRARGR